MNRFKIGHQTLTWGENPNLEEMLQEIKEPGYEGVEFAQHLEKLGSPHELKKMLDEANLEVVCLANGDLKQRIDYGVVLGAKHLLIVEEKPEYVEKMAAYASAYDIDLVLHPHMGGVETEEDIDRFLAKSPHSKFCPDVAHLTVIGSDPIEVIKKYADRIVYVHLKDWGPACGREKDYWRGFCELGKGIVDVPGTINALEEINYEGWLMVELDSTQKSPIESAKLSRNYLKSKGY